MSEAADIYEERAACPLYTAIALIDGRWKPMIVQRLAERPTNDATRHHEGAARPTARDGG